MKIAARRLLTVAFTLALIASGSMLGAGSASADIVHDFEFSFDGQGTPNGPFEEGSVGNVAVDQESGDVYVEDVQSGAIFKFDAAGKYLSEIDGKAVPQGSLGLSFTQSGMAVDDSSGANKGDLYVAGTINRVVYKFDASGRLLSELTGSDTPAGSFTPHGIAVDPSGDVYVADSANGVIDKFDSAGNYLSQISSPYIEESTGAIAVDSLDNVYLSNRQTENTVKLEPGGGASVLTKETHDVAVDPATDHVYVAENNYPAPTKIAEYDPSGKRLGGFGEEDLGSNVWGVAVRGATGQVYVGDYTKSLIQVFGPAVVVPDVTTEEAASVQPTSATLNGVVNPEGLQVTGCQFEYGTSTAYGQSVSCAQSPASIGSGTSPVTVTANLGSLLPDTEYHVRLAAANANGTNHGKDLTFTTTGPPRIDNESATNLNRTTATLEGEVNPFGFDSTYRFEYGTSTSYGTSVPVPNADIGSGMSDVAVSQAISGLLPGVTYHYRIVATNTQSTVVGADREFTTVAPASIDSEYAIDVASTSATLDANVNPIGSSTEYRLEYGTTAAYGHSLSGSAGEGASDLLVGFHLQELLANTTYHYRFIVSNVYGTVDGADHWFTTQAANGQEPTLPDGRAWELVSPQNKKGSTIEPFSEGEVQAASDGSAISYLAGLPLGEHATGNGEGLSQVLSRRQFGAWESEDITLPNGYPPEGESANALAGPSLEYRLFSPELSWSVLEPQIYMGPLSPEATERTLYLRNDVSGGFVPLVTPNNVPSGTKFGGEKEVGAPGNGVSTYMHFLAASPDLHHIVLGSALALTPEATSELEHGGSNDNWNLYEWSGGKLQLVNILPDGSPQPRAALGRSYPHTGPEETTAHTVSDDGRWVVWSPEESSVLYVRDMVNRETIQLGGSNALFETMSSDGSRIFYLEGGDLYEYNVGTRTQTNLTGSHAPGENAGVKDAVLGASEDGSYVYFVATAALANGASAGEDNLYVAHDTGAEWTTGYIATLSAEDEKSWSWGTKYGTHAQVDSRVSPDGRYVAFMSDRSLTGYDNDDAVSGHPDEEVFLYDAVSNRLICASCNPTGARPFGVHDVVELGGGSLLVDRNLTWSEGQGNSDPWLAGSIPGWDNASSTVVYQPRYLSDSGRLFFDSPDVLVPQDTNGVMDVYEYEPDGVGSCAPTAVRFIERVGGCVNLISSGISYSESTFYDASEDGDDVFFTTVSQLVAADYDQSYDVYDAHVCSVAVPCVPAPVSSPPCTSGDSCKVAPSPQPAIFGPTASATFSGTGNVAASGPAAAVKPKSTNVKKLRLARELRACRVKHVKRTRAACERQARRRYGAKRSRVVKVAQKGKG